MGKKIMAANWKEHPLTLRDAERLFAATAKLAAKYSHVEMLVCPPALYIQPLAGAVKGKKDKKRVALGAQDVFYEESGAFTGAIGPKMLRSAGAEYAIVGHSERRNWFGEDDKTVAKKVEAADAAGLKVILCIGEHAGVRKKGMAAAKRYLQGQLSYGLKEAIQSGLRNIIVAYEPVWAIGSGHNDDPRDAAEIAAFIKSTARKAGARRVKVLYGGSVNARDVRGYLASPEIDGALVGGASIQVETLKKLLENYE